ncbi:MAG: PIN domain-containing protein [Deinococcus-Thermus bacterium]|nr:PIN domain-containing protein [Deinococcota bacterium]
MILDASVVLQILFGEEGWDDALELLVAADALAVAAPTVLESEIVWGSRRGFGGGEVRTLLRRLDVEIVAFGDEEAEEARLAYARFGRGSGHPARLNFGDCIAYATACVRARPLVCKGDDFARTDLRIVRTDPPDPG